MVGKLNKREIRELDCLHHEILRARWNIDNIVRIADAAETKDDKVIRWLTDDEMEILRNVVTELLPIESRIEKIIMSDWENDKEGYGWRNTTE